MATSNGIYVGIDGSKDRLMWQFWRRSTPGRKRGYRKTKRGLTEVRSLLYISTLVATRCNPVIHAQYQQLLTRGKLKKVALTACIRKFLTILNAMMRDQRPFRAQPLLFSNRIKKQQLP